MAKLKADMEKPGDRRRHRRQQDLAQRAGIDGTPTFIVNGVMHPGAVDDELMNSLAAELISD